MINRVMMKAKKAILIITEIRRQPKKQKRKRIIYEDEIDGFPEYEPDWPTEEEQEEEDQNYEIQKKSEEKQL